MAFIPGLETLVIDKNEKGFPLKGKGKEAWYRKKEHSSPAL